MNVSPAELFSILAGIILLLFGVVRADRDGLFRALGSLFSAYVALRVADLLWTPVTEATLTAWPDLSEDAARPLVFAALFLSGWIGGVIIVGLMPHQAAVLPVWSEGMPRMIAGLALGLVLITSAAQSMLYWPAAHNNLPISLRTGRAIAEKLGQKDLPTADEIIPPPAPTEPAKSKPGTKKPPAPAAGGR
jgi:hypothetical protein